MDPWGVIETSTPNCDKAGVEGNSAQSEATILKSLLCHQFEESLVQTSVDYFNGFQAAGAANEEDLFLSCCLQHNCCMLYSFVAEKGYDKMIRFYLSDA